jgi:hypothetical protein
MPTFSRHDIDTMGFRAADDLKQGIPLHTSIVKIARDNSMNPEQIKRLVESANTTAFLNEFKGKTGNQRMVEFDVADPAKVIEDALGGSDAPSSAQGGTPSIAITISFDQAQEGLHDEVADERTPIPTSDSTKVASYGEVYQVKLARERDDITSLDINQLARVQDSLLTKIADCNYRAQDLADEIARSYRGIYTRDKHANFELDALSGFGNSALPALQLVRSRLGMPKLASRMTPQQEFILGDRHVVEGDANFSKVAQIVSLCSDLSKLRNSLAYSKTLVGGYQ